MTKILTIIMGAFILTASMSCNVKGEHVEAADADPETAAKDYTQENMTIKEFVSWCADDNNKLTKLKEILDMKFKLSYLPPESMAFLELRTEAYDLTKFQKTCQDYSAMTYFNFRLEAIKGKGELLKYRLRSPAQYEARIKYMSFNMQNDICLVQGKDTLLPGLFHFERAFEAAPYATTMFAFDNKKFNKNSDFTIFYNDRLFEKGYVKFSYKNGQLINIPNISEL